MLARLSLRLARRRFGLPPRRCDHWSEKHWLEAGDGVRLATQHLCPVGLREAPTVVVRSLDRLSGAPALLVRMLAESGFHVVVQQVRGRDESEGRFTPFEHEERDSSALLEWVAAQSWFDGRLGLAGAGYSAFTAWAALAAAAAAERPVGAMVVASGTRSLHRAFYPGGAFSLAAALAWGLGLGDRTRVSPREIDLERALRYRPLIEADRVALRQVDWVRDWLSHPRRDAYWCALEPDLPAQAPPTLLVADFQDPSLEALLGDHRALAAAALDAGAPPPALCIGPWRDGRWTLRGWRRRETRARSVVAREAFAFLDRELGGRGARGAADSGRPVHYRVGATPRWRRERAWPPAASSELALFLDSNGDAAGPLGAGRLLSEPVHENAPESSRVDRYSHDPASAQSPAAPESAARSNVCRYTGEALARDLEISGPVSALLFVRSSAPDTDFCARLVEIAPDGSARSICEGVQRCRWRECLPEESEARWLPAGKATLIEIELSSTAHRFVAGARVRLEVSSSSFPRFDRNPNSRVDPARATAGDCEVAHQSILHDAEHPSRLLVRAVEPAGRFARKSGD